MIAIFCRLDDSEMRQLVLDVCDRLTIPHNLVQFYNLDRRAMAAASYASIIRSADASIIDVDVMNLVDYAIEFGAIGTALNYVSDQPWDFRQELEAPIILFTKGQDRFGANENLVAEYFGKYYSVISAHGGITPEIVRSLADWLRSSLDKTAPKLFISYRSTARNFADRVARSMKRRGAFVWYDQWEILPGDSVTSAIDRGLSWATQLILLVDRTFTSSRFVDMELHSFLHRFLAGPGQVPQYVKSIDRPIIPVILEGGESHQLPLAIQQLHYINCNVMSFRAAMDSIWSAVRPPAGRHESTASSS